MAVRIHLVFLYAAIFLLSLCNVNTLTIFNRPKSPSGLKSFSWKACGPATDPVQVKTVDVAPDPIQLPGNLTVGFTSTDTVVFPDDIYISLTIEKKVAGFYIKIPCVDDYGSCKYTNLCPTWKEVCPKYFEKFGFPCSCPAPAGNYSLPDTVFEITTKIPFIATGTFRVTADIGSSEYHLFCLQIVADVKGG